MRYFYDTEFIEDGRSIELISIGIVTEDGSHGEMCWPDHECCTEVNRVDAREILAVLDGEGEKPE